jgi:DNA-binding XRE family transcriptional regulator
MGRLVVPPGGYKRGATRGGLQPARRYASRRDNANLAKSHVPAFAKEPESRALPDDASTRTYTSTRPTELIRPVPNVGVRRYRYSGHVPRRKPKLNIATRIRDLRSARSMTQAQLAEAADVALETLSRIERGCMSPSVEMLERLAAGLDVPVESNRAGVSPIGMARRHSHRACGRLCRNRSA